MPMIATAVYRAYSGGISNWRNPPMTSPKAKPKIIRYIINLKLIIYNLKNKIYFILKTISTMFDLGNIISQYL
jgi:hypothetical protein